MLLELLSHLKKFTIKRVFYGGGGQGSNRVKVLSVKPTNKYFQFTICYHFSDCFQ